MSVPNQTPYIIYNANGMTTVFPFEFYIINANDIQISLNGEVISSGYSVSGVGNIAGGDVIFLTPPANGTVVMLERVVPTYRLTDYQDNGDLLADTVNKDFDRLWMAIQRYGIHLGLALKRPLFGGPFDAEGYRISDLADPVNDQDAATKKYVESVSLARTLRVPENTVQAVPSVSMRANKLLAFNAAGDPIAVLPASGSASDVLIELAKPTGAGLSGTTSGGTVQTDLDKLNTQNGAFAYVEDYASLVVSGDWTAAINAAFATGKPVVGKGPYNVTGIINTKGQKVIGTFIVNSTRRSMGNVTFNSDVKTPHGIRMMYVSSAYDLSEMMYIKSLGFNTVHHYIDWLVSEGNEDSLGTIQQMLDNCLTAGLRVQLKTEDQGDVATFINTWDSHPAVFSYSVYDEPATRGISVVDQTSKYNVMRPLTKKPLTVVDLAPASIFKQALYVGYDIAFVDSYALHYTTGDLSSWLTKDLAKHRKDFGALKSMCNASKTIPVFSAFLDPDSYYSKDKQQVINSSKVFGTAGKGEYGCFIWDGNAHLLQCARQIPEFREMIAELAGQAVGVGPDLDSYIFGGSTADGHWPINPLIEKCQRADTTGSSDPFSQFNAYPVRVKTGASETDRTTTAANYDFSGIGIKGAQGAYATTIPVRNHVNFTLEVFAAGVGMTRGTFSLYRTSDGGYTISLMYNAGVGGGGVVSGDFAVTSKPEETLIFRLDNPGDASVRFRKFIRGLIVLSEW
ncbi:phage tail fiber protein [Enterobacter asburiae]